MRCSVDLLFALSCPFFALEPVQRQICRNLSGFKNLPPWGKERGGITRRRPGCFADLRENAVQLSQRLGTEFTFQRLEGTGELAAFTCANDGQVTAGLLSSQARPAFSGVTPRSLQKAWY